MSPTDVPPRLLTQIPDAGADAHPAIVDTDATTSYAELRLRARNLAAALQAAGLRPGDRVLVVLPNDASFAVALFAVWRAGGIAVPMDHRSPVEQVMRVARDCQAEGIACDGHVFSKIEARLPQTPVPRVAVVKARRPGTYRLPTRLLAYEDAVGFDGALSEAEARPGDLAALMYTSGSTGRPKGVMHSHESLLSSIEFTCDHLEIQRADRVLVSFPLYHLFSFRVLLAHLRVGATAIVAPDILAGLKRAPETRPDALILVPAACALVVQRFAPVLAQCAPLIRRVSVGSAAISPELLAEIQRLLPGAKVHIPYGMTEARIGFLEPVEGRAQRRLCAVDPNLEARVLDEDGRPVREGVGELVLRGRALMLGYWHNSPAENRKLREEGLHTRDLMEVTPGGERFLVGRLDDVISVGGEKVFPAEVEAALLAHPRIRDARVLGEDDPRGVRGQVVKAAIVLDPACAFDRDDILAHCRARLEPYKIPAIIEPVTGIPRNEMGKLTRLPRT